MADNTSTTSLSDETPGEDLGWVAEALAARGGACGHDEHRGPQGPNEDIAFCYATGLRAYSMRPENEQIGLHADDCSLPRRHNGYCVGGGHGHPPTAVVRGYWPGMDADIAAARQRFAEPQTP